MLAHCQFYRQPLASTLVYAVTHKKDCHFMSYTNLPLAYIFLQQCQTKTNLRKSIVTTELVR